MRMLWTLLIAATAACAVSCAFAQEMAFIIRHADVVSGMDDPPLSTTGRERAKGWAEMLRDAGIDVVVHTDAARSRETGRLVADALAADRREVPIADMAALLDLLTFDHAEDRVLVVAHSETIPGLLERLGIAPPEEVAKDDYANLFVVTFTDGEALAHARLRMP